MNAAGGLSIALVLSAGPSFDCVKAASESERAVCASRDLSTLDERLAAEYAAAMKRNPAGRASLREVQAAWLAWRDASCGADARCLDAEYRARLSMLLGSPSGDALPLCWAFAQSYRSILASRSALPRGEPTPSALELLEAAGLRRQEPIATLPDGSLGALAAWGDGLTPPLRFDGEPFDWHPWGSPTIDQVPGQRWFAVSVVEGTAHCVHSACFNDRDGRARRVPCPPSWSSSEAGESCGQRRAFGLARGAPVALVYWEGRDDLSNFISISRWAGGQFGPACRMSFLYALRYGPPSKDVGTTFPETCYADCEPLRVAAQRIVLALARTQGVTDQDPVTTTEVIGGVQYRVGAGRVTIGWRVFAHWRVTFTRTSDGAEVASIVLEARRAEPATVDVR